MNIKLFFFMACLFGSLPLSYAQEKKLIQAKPKKCVALHKGQTCYQKIRFILHTPNDREYCLVNSEKKILHCWDDQAKGVFILKFKSTESQNFYLINKASNETLETIKIDVAWVYKQNKKSFSGWRWRAF